MRICVPFYGIEPPACKIGELLIAFVEAVVNRRCLVHCAFSFLLITIIIYFTLLYFTLLYFTLLYFVYFSVRKPPASVFFSVFRFGYSVVA